MGSGSSPRRSQLVSAALAAGAVGVVALASAVAGVDDVEVLATLFFGAVFLAAFFGGRSVGYAVAAVASLGYLALRYEDIDQTGMLRVVLLVAARAACYGIVAYATPILQDRIPALSGTGAAPDDVGRVRPGRGRREPVEAAIPAAGHIEWSDTEADSEADVAPVPSLTASEPWEPVAAWGGGEVSPETPTPAVPAMALDDVWGEPEGDPLPAASLSGPPEPLGPPPDPFAPDSFAPAPEHLAPPEPFAPTPGYFVPPPADPLVEPEPSVVGGNGGWSPSMDVGPPAPTVPTGWVDDATVPLGDESIPVGFTGELFVPKDLRQAPYENRPPTVRSGNGSLNGGGRPSAVRPYDDRGDEHRGYDDHAHGRDDVRSEPPPPPREPQPVDSAGQGAPASVTADRGVADIGGAGGVSGTGAIAGGGGASAGVDPETRLWNAHFFRETLTEARDDARRGGSAFSVVMVRVPDEPFQTLPYRRQVALLRELGHQFVQARMIDHLVHLPDGAQHWFAVVLPGADRPGAHLVERRLRSAIAGYLRSRGLHLGDVQSASLTSPDDDEAMAAVWQSLLGARN